jgi:hypothetical protein
MFASGSKKQPDRESNPFTWAKQGKSQQLSGFLKRIGYRSI